MSKHLISIHFHQLLGRVLFSCDLACKLRHCSGKYVPDKDCPQCGVECASITGIPKASELITSVSTEEGPQPSPLFKDHSGVWLIYGE